MIPSSVTSINGNAFQDCYEIKSAEVPGWSCNIPNFKGVTNLVISPGTLSIVDSAFKGWSGLTSVTIPDSVTSIGSDAFYGCSGLTSVTIPDSVIGIGLGAFSGCAGLEEITLPFVGSRRGNTGSNAAVFGWIFGENAYAGGTGIYAPYKSNLYYVPSGLRKVLITDETVLGYGAFKGCSGLTSVTIPDSVTSIGSDAFYGCSGLTSVHICDLAAWCQISFGSGAANPLSYAHNIYLNGALVTNLTIPDSVTSIGGAAFSGCSGLTSVTIPDSVTSIGGSAFSGCSGLTSVTIPDSVTSIGDYAFRYCSGLTSVTIPDSVTSIGGWAFSGCSSLASVTIPNSVTSFGLWDTAFSDCNNVKNATVPGWSCGIPFDGVTNLVISPGTTIIKSDAFSNCTNMLNVTIPDSVTSIESNAFYDTPFYNNQPDGLVVLGRILYCMKGNCPVEVTIPNGLVSISPNAFLDCSGLMNLTIPNGVTSIGECAFYNCCSLTSVTIPASVKSIGNWAFEGCNNVKNATVPGRTCGISFVGVTNLVISSGTTSIRDRAFERCSGLTSVTIPDSVTSIGANAFNGCSGLERIFASVTIDEALVGGLDSALLDKVVWTDVVTGGDAEWAHNKETVHSGIVSWKSGGVADNQESWFEMDVDHPGRLSFWWKASSESDGAEIYDYAYLSVDGVPQGSLTDGYLLEGVAIGGKTDWVNVVIDVDGAGPHTIRWTYCKDDVDEADIGEDCVWLDDIVWTPLVSVSYDIGGASGVAPNGVAMLAGTTLTLPDAAGFSWTDHVFDGWSDGENTYLPGETYEVPRTDVTFTAQWIRKSVLTFALNGGSGTAPTTIKEIPGTKVTLPLATGLSKAKHTFGGWNDGATTYNEGAEYVIGDQDVAFAAVWTANTLAVPVISSVGVSNGGTIETASATISISAENGVEIRYTMDGSTPTAASPRYTAPFVADGLNVTIKAIAVRDNYFDSDVATFSFTRKPYSLSECLGMDGTTVTTGGNSSWGRVLGSEAYDGVAALKSGTLGDSQTNWVQIVVSGPGTVSFWWKVSSEGINRGKRRDGCLFMVDGVEAAYSDGTNNVAWTQVTVEVDAPGTHTLKWAYGKNDNDTSAGDDCAWLAEVVWTQGIDPSVPHWAIVYENLKGVANPNPSKYYEGYGVTFQPLSDVSGYTFAGWTPNSISASATGDKTVTANWNWIPEDATVEASITGGKPLNVDANWVRTELAQRFGAGKQQSFIAKFGDNLAAALTKKTGKRDGAGNELAVWHDYVAGTDPTDSNSTFKATIEFKNGMPVVEWEPNLNSNGEQRVYTLYGKADLADAWHTPTNALDRFFKVDVAMPLDGTVTFNVDGGSSVDPIVVRVGQPIGELPTPTRQGYDFLGWFSDAYGTAVITPETIVTDDMTIYAHWEKIPLTAENALYCVVDLSSGANAASYPVSYLSEIPAGGWSDEDKTSKLVLRRIEPGTFLMGGSYQVTLTQPYYIGVFEVTQKQYELVAGTTTFNFSGDTLPAEMVSYNMIRGSSNGAQWPSSSAVDNSSFLGMLRARTGIDFDLPTEAQWEYACRAGTTTKYYWGGAMDGNYYWYTGNSGGTSHSVGSTIANAWGIYDMSGNVWEQCLDWYGSLSDGVTNPIGATSGSGRVIRGGGWFDQSYCGASSNRNYWDPSVTNNNIGFRVIFSL